MTKRIETNIQPINPKFFDFARVIADDPDATPNERMLALLVEEFGLTVNILLSRLEFGMVSVTDEPPDENRQYSRPFRPRRS